MQYKNFTLDKFQEQAVIAIDNDNSVVVSAPTGTGKTLIADYIINKFKDEPVRIIYTAPIKALSNQKFRDFTQEYGYENVGIMTGDVVLNPDARILIMTTEIFRNMLITKDPSIHDIKYVVFDEIHYINDVERGKVWEESIIFSPENIRFLCLSATIPNADEFAEWIHLIKHHKVEVVKNEERAVPLMHIAFDKHLGQIDYKTLREHLNIPEYKPINRRQKKKREKKEETVSHLEVVEELQDKTPILYFAFSRKQCERMAKELAMYKSYTTPEQRTKILNILNRKMTPEIKKLSSVSRMIHVATKGIAYHHAGVLPALKEAVEEMFADNLIQVLYTTETFAVGINMPAKTVVFDSIMKFDGINFRYLNTKEYFQIAGRAGRRGIDKEGYSVVIYDRSKFNIHNVMKLVEKDVEPIISQYYLSVNTVLNLLKYHDEEQIEVILKSNFYYFLKKKEGQVRIMASFNNKIKQLRQLEYIDRNNQLTEKGNFASNIFFNETLITELFFTGLYKELNETELLTTIAAIVYEPRTTDHFSFKGVENKYNRLVNVLCRNNVFQKDLNKRDLKRLINMVAVWVNHNRPFSEMLDVCNLLEGDIIRFFRRLIDMVMQIDRAANDAEIINMMRNIRTMLERDILLTTL